MQSTEYWQLVADLGNGYSNIRPMDEGGMGSIYRAHKDSLDVEVVIKKIKKKFSGRLNERAEANILKLLKHKYLPRIYDVIESRDGYIYTIMDLIPGENLQHYITNHGPASQKLAYRWACQLCEVIDYLHAQTPPILHCDIKPSNIIVTPSGDICLIDFNTSLVFADGVLAIGATPGYAAPEQYTKMMPSVMGTADETVPAYTGMSNRTGSRTTGGASYSLTAAQTVSAGNYGTITQRTDIYGAGATLYFAVTGVRPNRSLEPVKPITAYKLRLSRSFQEIILRAMQKNPQDRFESAKEMLRALKDIHTIDTRYKNIVCLQWVASICVILCIVIGAGLTIRGVNLISQENEAEYAYNILRGQTARESTQFEEAEKYLDAAIAIYDNRLEAYAEKALLRYRQGEYNKCIDEIKTIFSRPLVCNDQQEWANICYVAANSYYEIGDYENAVLWYKQALEYSPSVNAYRDCAIALAQQGKSAEAKQMLEQMCSSFPDAENTASYQIVYAEISAATGNNEEALQLLWEIVSETSDEQLLSRAYIMAAQIYKQLGDDSLEEEIALLEDGIARLSGSYRNMVGSYLGIAYAQFAELSDDEIYLQKALETFELLVENGLRTFSVRLNIAVLQQQLKQYDAAVETLESLVEDYPNEYSVYKKFALLYMEIESQQRNGYTQTQAYYEMAEQYYQIAKAAGVEDAEMTQLEELVLTLQQAPIRTPITTPVPSSQPQATATPKPAPAKTATPAPASTPTPAAPAEPAAQSAAAPAANWSVIISGVNGNGKVDFTVKGGMALESLSLYIDLQYPNGETTSKIHLGNYIIGSYSYQVSLSGSDPSGIYIISFYDETGRKLATASFVK